MSGSDPAWIDRRLIIAIHGAQIAEFGGASGIRDEGLLESALAQPRNHAAYTGADIVELAAIYALAIARNHPFIDGNKRTAYVALEFFLVRHAFRFAASDLDAVTMMLQMAAGEIGDAAFIAWVRDHAEPAGSG